ncbi:MAG: nucleotidyltransferase domain-containing protein [Nitrospinae bacterium]|nr:nucleotidyltransferase domain-containing protein [Nitrospinota bacterium]
MVEREIVREVQRFLAKLKEHGFHVDKIILYGSRVSGKARKYSDIDVAVVSQDFGKDRYEEGAKLFEIAARVNPLIEPVPISRESFENDTWLPLIYEIRKNGIELKAA